MRELVDLVDEAENTRDDGILGEAFVRAGVAGTGHRKLHIPVERYLRQQRQKKPSNQSFRTTARGLRELFEHLGFIVDTGARVEPSELGRQAATYAGSPLDARQVEFWRRVIRNLSHDGGDGESSHPYQVLLRLVGQRPGITRAKCALALEARNDSAQELGRIVGLARRSEDQIRHQIGVSQANWDNAKKVLPSFAEQLGDVIRRGQSFWLADAPGRDDAGPADRGERARGGRRGARAPAVRAPRTSRQVTPDTIARVGNPDNFDEVEVSPNTDLAVAAEAIRRRRDRWRRHQAIVKDLGTRLAAAGATLNEDPFDILAVIQAIGFLVEVKTLDGTAADERERVRDAAGQLLYYEAFVTKPIIGEETVHKVACFESPISEAHEAWLNQLGIAVIWKTNGGFAGDELAARGFGDYLQELC